MAIDINEFWDVNYYNHPPLTDAMLAKSEKELGVKLPALLVELLRIQNGGYTKGFEFPIKEKTSRAENCVPLSVLFGIVIDESIETAQNILQTPYMTEEWGLPQKQVLLCGDGHWWITLDYRKGDTPSIRWIDTERDQDIYLADTFEDFIFGLVPEGKNEK